MHNRGVYRMVLILSLTQLMGCQPANHTSQPPDANQDKSKMTIQPAKKLGTDATLIAQDTNTFLNQAEPKLQGNPAQFEAEIYTPVRQLLVRWNNEVKQADSVVGDPHTICRGALISFDSLARHGQKTDAPQKQQIYQQQKQQCEQSLRQPQKNPNVH